MCCLGHGDILVMDGQCQDEFLHRTDSATGTDKRFVPLDQTACFLLFLSSGTSGMLFANVCAGFISSCYGACSFRRFFGSLASSRCLVRMGGAGLASPPVVHKTWVAKVCLLPNLLRAKVGGGMIFVTPGDNAW